MRLTRDEIVLVVLVVVILSVGYVVRSYRTANAAGKRIPDSVQSPSTAAHPMNSSGE